MNRLIILTSKNQTDTGEYTIRFSRPFDLRSLKWNASVGKISTYFSWFNISSSNNVFKYNNGSIDRTLTLETGCYSFQSLVEHIHDKMTALGDFTLVDGIATFSINFELDLSDGDVSMLLSDSYTVDFTGLNIRTIFGFNSNEYTTSSVSENKANIRNGVDTVLIHCDLISGNSYYNGIESDVIYSFIVNAEPNEVINIDANNSTPVAVKGTSSIDEITIRITDQDNRKLDLHGQQLNIEILYHQF